MGRCLLICASALLAFPCSAPVTQASPQPPRPGSIVGTVVDEDGKPVLGPAVSYSFSMDHSSGTVSSNSNASNGEVELTQVPLGKID
jgi:hypothetical protein